MTAVHCYAGASYPDRPLEFEWHGDWLQVEQVLSRVRTPAGVGFRVQVTGGQRYRLEWYEATDTWEVALLT